jgi:RNA polymerase sigma-70 factor (ECF subfamily)
VDRYMDPGYAVALGILRQPQDAEDAVQSAFIRALERIDQLRPGSPFGPWFYRVLRSTCLNLLRREALRDHDPLPRSASGAMSPQRDLERRMARDTVLEALAQLPEMQRLAVTLYDLEGYSHQQVAEILDIAEGTSRAHVHHGRRALRDILGPIIQGTEDEER